MYHIIIVYVYHYFFENTTYCFGRDNASTSFPKPPQVAQAMFDYVTGCGCNIGRGGYEGAYQAEETVLLVCEDDLPEALQTLTEADAPLRQLRETSPLVLILDMPEESAEP